MSAVVIGGGVAGLGAAWALARAGVDVRLLEASDRIGGLVETEHTPEGCLLEHGPDAFLEARPGMRQLIEALGMADEVVRDGPAPRRAYVALDATRLVPLPEGLAGLMPRSPWSMFRTPLLGPGAKLRLLVEPLVRDGVADGASVADFVERRMGVQTRERLIDPLLRGIYGVRGDALELDATMPHLRAMVREHGSLGLAVLKAMGRPPMPGLAALRGGMATLPRRMADEIGWDRIACETPVVAIERTSGGRLRVRTADSTIETDQVVIGASARQAARMLEGLSPELSEELATMPHVSADVVTLAYDRDDVARELDGTGHVVAAQGARTRACTWASAKWRGRAPDGTVLLRTVVDAPDASDEDVVTLARSELEPLLGVRAEPKLVRVRRHRGALVVPGLGHLERRRRIAEHARAIGAVRLVGGAAGAIGIPDCLTTAQKAVAELTA